MEIRRLYPDEQPPISLLLLADPSQELVEDYLQRGLCYVALLDKQAVGVYVLLPTRPDTIEIVNVAVEEHYQGQGIGKKLVQDAIEQAKQSGYTTVEIGTGSTSIVQLALYQKCGFRMTSIDRDFFLRHYNQPIFENGMQVMDMVRLSLDLNL